MFAFISHWGMNLYRHGTQAPLWHALVTPENSLALNVLAAVLAAVGFGIAFRGIVARNEDHDALWTPWAVAIAFLAVPPFVPHLLGLSPVMFTLAPIALSLAVLSLERRLPPMDEDAYVESKLGGIRVACAGALAAVAAWEGTIGLAFAPILLLTAWLPDVRRELSLFEVVMAWMLGFAVAFAGEGLLIGFPWLAFKPVMPPLAGLVVFFFIGFIPAMIVRRFEENRWTIGGWAVVLAVFAILTLSTMSRTGKSGCERFARAVLADLGDRKLIIGDGLTDDFFELLKPADARVVGTRTNADREFLLSVFDGREAITNKALVVRQYHHLPEMEAAAAEFGLVRRKTAGAKDERKQKAADKATQVAITEDKASGPAALSNEMARISKEAEPMLKALAEIESMLKKPAKEQNREQLGRNQEIIRQAWQAGRFRGTRLSNALLMADIMLGDRETIESDAITALMIDRDDPTANGALGGLRQEEGKLELAERYLRKGVKGGGVFPMGKLAILLIQTGRPDEAVEWARKAVEKQPEACALREPLAAALVESGRFDEAEKELTALEELANKQEKNNKTRRFVVDVRKRLAERRSEKSGKASR